MDPSPGQLQFDKAEYEKPPAGVTCAMCARAIPDTYFEVNAKLLCPTCKQKLEQALTGGSPAGRAIKAAVFGTLVAALGAGLWYGVRAATGMEIGLISIVIGIGVGMAVRKGCEGRGGWFYQAMAMFLTYSAIAMTYVPVILTSLGEEVKKDHPAPAATTGTPPAPTPIAAGEKDPAPAAAEPAAAPAAEPSKPTAAAADAETPSGGKLFIGVVVFGALILAFAYAAPFLGGFDNIIGLLIIAFGVWEAWRLNKRMKLQINGPLKVAPEKVPTDG